MDPSVQDLTIAMLLAVKNRNLIAFRHALEQGFDVRSYVRSNNYNSSDYMPFVEKVARSRFSEALRFLLIDMQPCVVRREDAVRAFYASVKSKAQQHIITVFVEASILGTLPVLSLTDSYRYAMEHSCWRSARSAVDVQGFNANCCLQLSAGAWERPIHSAIKHYQYRTATRLLQMGAEVDAPNCYGITALMMACGRVHVDSVRILLSHGADPNSADGIKANTWPLAASEFPGSMFSKQKRPVYQNIKTNPKRWQQTRCADRIIDLMVNAGLRPSPGGWLQRTAVVAHMSREAGQVLRDLIDRMPKPSKVANVLGRQGVGQLMKDNGGAGSIETMDDDFTLTCKRMNTMKLSEVAIVQVRQDVGQFVAGKVRSASNKAVDDCTLPFKLMEQLNIGATISREGVGQLVNEKAGSGSNETVEDDSMLPYKLMEHLNIGATISREGVGQLVNEKVGSGSNETTEDDSMLPCKLMEHLNICVPD